MIGEFQQNGIRTSVFIGTDLQLIEAAAKTGTDRIELYTEDFATQYEKGNKAAIKPYTEAAILAHALGLGINAGHDLSLENIQFFKENIPNLAEVSIGHALIAESLYLGLENVVNMYLDRLTIIWKFYMQPIKGTGKPLLILHGYFGMSDNWKTLGNQFAENYQVHLIDQRNHGRSFHASEFNYALLVEDLYRYIQHHQLEAVHLLGHSMGGKTAMLFAVTHPQMIAKLMIADISPRKYEPHHNAILAGLNSIDFSIQTTRSLVDAKLAELIPEVGIRQFLLKNVYWIEKGKLAFRFHLQSLN